MTRRIAAACLLAVVGSGAAVAAERFAEVTGETPSVYRRPVIDDAQIVGQLLAGDRYPLLLELDTGLPQPFFRILYGGRPVWLYGGSARQLELSEELSAAEREAVARYRRSADEAARPAIAGLLRAYDEERRRLAGDYGFDDLPAVELATEEPIRFDLFENRATLRLTTAGGAAMRLPQSDRLLFQLLVAALFEELEEAESCRLTVERGDGPAAGVEVARRDWENALDLSLEAFWQMADKENTDMLWEVP